MVKWRDIFTSFTIKFGALSLIFAFASTAGEYRIVVTFDGIRLVSEDMRKNTASRTT